MTSLRYTRLMNWRVYAEEVLAKRYFALWLCGSTLLRSAYSPRKRRRHQEGFSAPPSSGCVNLPLPCSETV